MDETKQFHLSDVLSITHDRLFSTRHMQGVYEICNFLTQDNLFTHQLLRVHEECKAWLFTLHPQLRELPLIADEEADRLRGQSQDWVVQWTNAQIERFGEYLDVTPIPTGIHQYRNPIEEAVELVGKDRVIVVDKEPAQ